MTEQQMNTGHQHLDYLAKKKSAHRRRNLWGKVAGRSVGATLAIIILCGLALGGCDVADKLGELFRIGGNGEAEAQPAGERIIEMFAIDLATFVLQTDDTPPTIDVQDGFTKYTIQAATMNPRLNFTRLDGDTFTNNTLEADDEVIVRPTVGTVDLAVGTVTLNRQR